MLEILLLIAVTRGLAKTARARGHAGLWGGLGVLFWIGGEIAGFIVGGLLGLTGLAAYPLALVGAALGAGGAWLIISLLPARQPVDPWEPAPSVESPNYDPANPYSPPRRD